MAWRFIKHVVLHPAVNWKKLKLYRGDNISGIRKYVGIPEAYVPGIASPQGTTGKLNKHLHAR